VQCKQAATLCMSSNWPHAISLAHFGLVALLLDPSLYVLCLFFVCDTHWCKAASVGLSQKIHILFGFFVFSIFFAYEIVYRSVIHKTNTI